jgi:hypothetical protein
LKNINDVPAGVPLSADDLLEFHAARLLLLFKVCGVAGRIDGLTKMAKLDFFVRYPQFFASVCEKLGKPTNERAESIESAMIRFHYGPWDHRYYHILGYLEGRKLIAVTSSEYGAFVLGLTQSGTSLVDELRLNKAFSELQAQMARVKSVLGAMSGSSIKNLIYETFDEEVARRQLGEVIY